MPFSLIASTAWMLCWFAAIALPKRAADVRADFIALAASFVAVLSLVLWQSPPANGVALFIACAAAWQLLRPTSSLLSAISAGASAALGAVLQADQGAPLLIAALLAFSILCFSWLHMQRSDAFAPSRIKEQALMGLTLSAPAIAAAPVIAAGWRSALALNRTMDNAAAAAVPAWSWQFAALAVAIGILHGLWVRR